MKTPTMKVSGNEYARVPERLKLFREDCPNGLIETKPNIQEDGTLIFSARILKDKSKPESAEATGHAFGKTTGVKQFEKLETIAIGRALAILGYLASGEIASTEEMEEYMLYKEEQLTDAIDKIRVAQTLDQLKEIFMDLGPLMKYPKIIQIKNEMKEKLQNEDIK